MPLLWFEYRLYLIFNNGIPCASASANYRKKHRSAKEIDYSKGCPSRELDYSTGGPSLDYSTGGPSLKVDYST